MQNLSCDLCKRGIEPEDLRFVKFYKLDNDNREKPTKRELEICPICAEIAHTKVTHIEDSFEKCECK